MGVEKLVEAVAREIDPLPFDDGATGWVGMPATKEVRKAGARGKARAIVRAALEALREPTPGMVRAGDAESGLARGTWSAMIDAAIKEMGDA